MCVYTLKMMAKGGIHDHVAQVIKRICLFIMFFDEKDFLFIVIIIITFWTVISICLSMF